MLPRFPGDAKRFVPVRAAAADCDELWLQVGPWRYSVEVSGSRTYVSYDDRTIYLAESLPVDERFAAVWHEVLHAFLFYVPAPREEEEHARLIAFIAESVRQDLHRQGALRQSKC